MTATDVVDIAMGGGEAPACRAELIASDELMASSGLSLNNTSPESDEITSDEIYPVFQQGATAAALMSKTASLRRGGTISAAVGGAMAASTSSSRGGGDTTTSLALIERLEAVTEEKMAAGIDEFSRLFGQDDIRLLVDLLKLSVSGRCSGGGGGRVITRSAFQQYQETAEKSFAL